MKATLKFNLPEENDEYYMAVNGNKFQLVLWDLDQYLRNEIKYNDKEELQPIRNKIYELMEDYQLHFGD